MAAALHVSPGTDQYYQYVHSPNDLETNQTDDGAEHTRLTKVPLPSSKHLENTNDERSNGTA
jgi:hypothetical protein